MARFDKGLFGGFSGRLGNVVAYTLKGKTILRTVGTSTKPPTLLQLTVRQKMTVVNEVLKPILGLINVGFALAVVNTDKNPYNEATSYNTKHAMMGEYPNIAIDYSKLLVSMGKLQPAIHPAVTLLPTGIEFTWEVTADMEWSIKNDRAMLLIYFLERKEPIYILSGAQRHTGKDFIQLPPNYQTLPIACYISFIADDRKSISDSVWIGV